MPSPLPRKLFRNEGSEIAGFRQRGDELGRIRAMTVERAPILVGELRVSVSGIVPPKVVFTPFHYKEAAANLLTNDAMDPVCKIMEAKVCAVRVEK